MNRREFLKGAAAVAAVPSIAWARQDIPKVDDATLTRIEGSPRERGRLYGQKFRQKIHAFLEQEIYKPAEKKLGREPMMRYADAVLKKVRGFSPVVADEIEGIAEGTGLRVEEVTLINLHEEIGHAKFIPKVEKCTALAAGPPDTRDGQTYVGQNWDWMLSVYGWAQMLYWKRSEGPSVLGYAYPGLWIGAGLNSAGLALCWTWGGQVGIDAPNVGIPSYALLTHMLYQDSLKAALAEARRAGHAGWFNFVLGDAQGNLAVVEGTPKELVVEETRGHKARADYASRQITKAPEGKPIPMHRDCARMFELLSEGKGALDEAKLKGFFADHKASICKHPKDGAMTLDSMLFNCTKREAHVNRGPGCSGRWRTFRFD